MELTEAAAQAVAVRARFAAFEKSAYGREWTLSDIVAGLSTDVGDLARLVAAHQGIRPPVSDLQVALGHELSDVLWCVFVIADKVGIEIEPAFAHAMGALGEWLEAREVSSSASARVD